MTPRKTNWVHLAGTVGVLLTVTLVVLGFGNGWWMKYRNTRLPIGGSLVDPKTRGAAEDAELTKAPLGMLGLRFYESFEGKKRWNIRSQFAELHRKENYAFLEEVTSDFFSEKSGNLVQTKSRYGRSRLDKQALDLEGNVSIRSRRGYLFEMERLSYDGVTHEFDTDDAVSMRGPLVNAPEMMLKGTGLTGNIDTEHFTVKKNVSAQKKLKNLEWLKITSRSGEFYTEAQQAIFTGAVKATMPKLSIESDTFEVAVLNAAESILAKGNVSLRQKEMIGHAESAGMEVGSGKIVLEGNASMESPNSNRIQGKRIVLYTDDDRIEVESAEGSVH